MAFMASFFQHKSQLTAAVKHGSQACPFIRQYLWG